MGSPPRALVIRGRLASSAGARSGDASTMYLGSVPSSLRIVADLRHVSPGKDHGRVTEPISSSLLRDARHGKFNCMPTWCDYDVGGRGCTRPVYGKVRGCFQHARLKRDAVWAALGKRNPGMVVRLTWGNSRPQAGRLVGADAVMSERTAQQGAYNLSMWVFAAASAVTGVITLFLAI